MGNFVRFGGRHQVRELATGTERNVAVFGEVELEGVDFDEAVAALCVKVAATALAAVAPNLSKLDGMDVLWHATIVPMLSAELAARGGRALRVVTVRAMV